MKKRERTGGRVKERESGVLVFIQVGQALVWQHSLFVQLRSMKGDVHTDTIEKNHCTKDTLLQLENLFLFKCCLDFLQNCLEQPVFLASRKVCTCSQVFLQFRLTVAGATCSGYLRGSFVHLYAIMHNMP